MGKRVGVSSSSTNYSTSAIARRTGLTRDEIRELKEEGKRDIDERGNYGDRGGFSFDKGGFSFSGGINENGDRGGSIEAFGFGVEWGEGGGSVSFPGGIDISMSEQGCYVVQVHSIFGQEAFTNIQKKPECEDDEDNGNSNDSLPPQPGDKIYPKCLNPNAVVRFYGLTPSYYFTKNKDIYKSRYSRIREKEGYFESLPFIYEDIVLSQGEGRGYKNDYSKTYYEGNPPSGSENTEQNNLNLNQKPPTRFIFIGTLNELKQQNLNNTYILTERNQPEIITKVKVILLTAWEFWSE